MEEFKKGLADLKQELDGKLKEASEKSAQKFHDKLDDNLKKEVKQLTEMVESKEKSLKEAVDRLDEQYQKGMISQEQKSKSFEMMLKEGFEQEGVQEAWKQTKSGSFQLENLTGKAVGTMTESASLTGEVIAPTRRESIVELAQRPVHVRSLIPQGTMASNVFRYVEETAGEGNADVTGEGTTKNQVDYDLEAKDANVRKITAFSKVSEELIDDIPALTSFLSRRLTKDIRKKEDQQLLYGAGTGNNLTGLNANPTTFSAYTGDTNAQIIDLMIQVFATLEDLEYEANGILLAPKDYYEIYLAKDADGAYVKNDLVTTNGGQLFIAGIPVFRNTAVNTDEYFVGDWLNGSQIFDRMGVNVRFYEQDEDNAQKNLITVVAEERLAFPIFYPDSYVYGTLSTDIAKIQDYT